jgi:hypothetical protein
VAARAHELTIYLIRYTAVTPPSRAASSFDTLARQRPHHLGHAVVIRVSHGTVIVKPSSIRVRLAGPIQ